MCKQQHRATEYFSVPLRGSEGDSMPSRLCLSTMTYLTVYTLRWQIGPCCSVSPPEHCALGHDLIRHAHHIPHLCPAPGKSARAEFSHHLPFTDNMCSLLLMLMEFFFVLTLDQIIKKLVILGKTICTE